MSQKGPTKKIQYLPQFFGRVDSLSWAPRSPDLTPLELRCWGSLSRRIFTKRKSKISRIWRSTAWSKLNQYKKKYLQLFSTIFWKNWNAVSM